MKEKFKSVGDWFKEKKKSKNKLTLETIADMLHQDLNLNRIEKDKSEVIIKRLNEENEVLTKRLSSKDEEIKKLIQKINELHDKLNDLKEHLLKLVEITKNSNKEFAEGLAKITEGTLVIEKLPEDKARGNQKVKIKDSSKTSRIIKAVTK